jgi:hypothetical protein
MTEDSNVLPEADEADEFEQIRDTVPSSDDTVDADTRPLEANEADVVEQSRALPITDEDESPDEP